MKKHKNRKVAWLLLILLLACSLAFNSCVINRAGKAERKAMRMERKAEKREQKAHKEALKAHRQMQSDQTLEMMKQMEKRNRKLNRHKRQSWFRRVFDSD